MKGTVLPSSSKCTAASTSATDIPSLWANSPKSIIVVDPIPTGACNATQALFTRNSTFLSRIGLRLLPECET